MKDTKQLLLEFDLPDFAEITDAGVRMLLEVQFTSNNGKWRVHKNDPDDVFPSDLHADRVDGPEKLDIYTGIVYDTRTRQAVRQMPKKVMRHIYDKLVTTKEPEIQAKLGVTSRFPWL